MIPECRHIMPTGAKCHAVALRGKAYCYFHMRQRQPRRVPRGPEMKPLKLPVLRDPAAIRTTLTQVFDALDAHRIDSERADLRLWALQIASQNVDPAKSNSPKSPKARMKSMEAKRQEPTPDP